MLYVVALRAIERSTHRMAFPVVNDLHLISD